MEEVSTRSCPGCNCRPTLIATSASLSSFIGSIEAEKSLLWVVMVLPVLMNPTFT